MDLHFILLIFVSFVVHSSATAIRGLPLEKLSFYLPEKDFTCLDGSSTIPFSYVNDDYCDCNDGSDEPGTAACAGNRFYCENKGHQSFYLLSSRVNDGVCDCCDGSDEWNTDATCSNTCIELGKKVAEEFQKLQELEVQGYRKKVEYITQGSEKKEEYENELRQVESDLGVLEAELESLRQTKEEAEEPESQMKDAHREKWEEEVNRRNTEKRESDARKAFDWLDTDSDGQVSVDEVMARPELDDDGDVTVTIEEAETYLDGNVPVDFETFLEKAWDIMAEKLKEENKYVDEEKVDKDYDEDDEDDDDEDYNSDYNSDGRDDGMPPYDPETQELIDIAEKARQAFKEAESRKKDLENRKRDFERYLNVALGRNHEFSSLFEECFEYTDREYTYKACMFQKVTQRSKNGGRETSLGNWEKWDGPSDNIYEAMKYSNGEKCWNGPNRSTRIILKCGTVDQLISASEPNKCEYEMVFTTPAFCEGKVKPGQYPHVEL